MEETDSPRKGGNSSSAGRGFPTPGAGITKESDTTREAARGTRQNPKMGKPGLQTEQPPTEFDQARHHAAEAPKRRRPRRGGTRSK